MPNPVARYHRRFWLGFLVAWLLLALIIRDHVNKIDGEVRREGLSSAAVVACRNTLIDVIDVETGLRGYLIAGKKEYLSPYYEGLGRLGANLVLIRSLMAGDPTEAPHAIEVEQTAKAVIAEFANQINIAESSGLEASRKRFAEIPTKPHVDSIRAHLLAIQVEEDRRLAMNVANLQKSMNTVLQMLNLFLVVLALVLLAMLTGALTPPIRTENGSGKPIDPSPYA